jgi:hypothetical protein
METQGAVMANWKHKVLFQRVLSRIPFGEQMNVAVQAVKRSPLFPDQGFEAETRDRMISVGRLIQRLSSVLPLEGATVLEVGTGWAPIPTILLYLAGVRTIHTYDISRRAHWSAMRSIIRALRGRIDECADALGQPRNRVDQRLARIEGATSMGQMLDLAQIIYVAPGNVLATGFPDGSIDLLFAYSVFEHIPLQVLDAMCREASRLLRQGTGRLCVQIDCGDNFAGFDKRLHALDYLKYSDEQWNRMVNDHNLHHFNRLREQEFLDILKGHGAVIDSVKNASRPGYVEYVKAIPLAERFRSFTPEQNAIVATEIIASFPGKPG